MREEDEEEEEEEEEEEGGGVDASRLKQRGTGCGYLGVRGHGGTWRHPAAQQNCSPFLRAAAHCPGCRSGALSRSCPTVLDGRRGRTGGTVVFHRFCGATVKISFFGTKRRLILTFRTSSEDWWVEHETRSEGVYSTFDIYVWTTALMYRLKMRGKIPARRVK